MKTFTTLTAVAALVAGMSVANAQNSGNTMKQDPAPNSINSGVQTGTGTAKSGTETNGAVKMKAGTNAQNKTETPPPSSINAGVPTGNGNAMSGAETKGSAMKKSGSATVGSKPEETPPPSSKNSGVPNGTGSTKSGTQQ